MSIGLYLHHSERIDIERTVEHTLIEIAGIRACRDINRLTLTMNCRSDLSCLAWQLLLLKTTFFEEMHYSLLRIFQSVSALSSDVKYIYTTFSRSLPTNYLALLKSDSLMLSLYKLLR